MERISARPRKKINYAAMARGEGGSVEAVKAPRNDSTDSELSVFSMLTRDIEDGVANGVSKKKPARIVVKEANGGGEKVVKGRLTQLRRTPPKGTTAPASLPPTLVSGRSPRRRMRAITLRRYDDGDGVRGGSGKESGTRKRQASKSPVGHGKMLKSKLLKFDEPSPPREWPKRNSAPLPASDVQKSGENENGTENKNQPLKPEVKQSFAASPVVKKKSATINSLPSHPTGGVGNGVRRRGKALHAHVKSDSIKERVGGRERKVPAALRGYDLGWHTPAKRSIQKRPGLTVVSPTTSSQYHHANGANAETINKTSSMNGKQPVKDRREEAAKSTVSPVTPKMSPLRGAVKKDGSAKKQANTPRMGRTQKAEVTRNISLVPKRETRARGRPSTIGFYRALVNSSSRASANGKRMSLNKMVAAK